MIDDPNLPPPVIEDDAAAKAVVGEPVRAVRLNSNPEDDERDTLSLADFAAAGVTAPDWANDPIPSIETWRTWRAAEDAAIAFKRAQAKK
ncbi:MAG: hypothetical protein R3C27_03090 [Hyphomonadaceae bacterium]